MISPDACSRSATRKSPRRGLRARTAGLPSETDRHSTVTAKASTRLKKTNYTSLLKRHVSPKGGGSGPIIQLNLPSCVGLWSGSGHHVPGLRGRSSVPMAKVSEAEGSLPQSSCVPKSSTRASARLRGGNGERVPCLSDGSAARGDRGPATPPNGAHSATPARDSKRRSTRSGAGNGSEKRAIDALTSEQPDGAKRKKSCGRAQSHSSVSGSPGRPSPWADTCHILRKRVSASSVSAIPCTPKRSSSRLTKNSQLTSTPHCTRSGEKPSCKSQSPFGAETQTPLKGLPQSHGEPRVPSSNGKPLLEVSPISRRSSRNIPQKRCAATDSPPPRWTPVVVGTRCKRGLGSLGKAKAEEKLHEEGIGQAQSQTCSSATLRSAESRGGRGLGAERCPLEAFSDTQPAPRLRPRFDLPEGESQESGAGDLSSDLSIELSIQESPIAPNSPALHEEEDEQADEEELPSFLLPTKPLPIKEGQCVWCKFRTFPFWPAMVKSINHKLKKASIIFIDSLLLDDKRAHKGFSVSLRTLKPFDCEEADQLACQAREKYDSTINWCLELIADYRIRIGCGSFMGTFMEYFADNISCPVRRKSHAGSLELTFPSEVLLEEQCGLVDERDEGSPNERPEESLEKKVLPDRSKASRNHANDKLVHFIIKKCAVEKHLLVGQREENNTFTPSSIRTTLD